MHTHPADPEGLSDGRRPLPSIVHLADFLDRHRRLTTSVDPLRFCNLDARLLPLADELAFHLGHHPQHSYEDRSCFVLGRKGGFEDRQGRAFGFKIMDEVQHHHEWSGLSGLA